MTTTAIIPARGGSKRIPRKNIRPFHGVPILRRTVAKLLDCGLFTDVLVSTDDDEIAQLATDSGASVPFRRPAALADDHAATAPVIAHAVQQLALAPATEVCVVYPGAVLTRTVDLIAANELLRTSHDADYVVSVVAFPAPVQRALLMGDDHRSRMIQPEHRSTRTQDLEAAYHDAGQFYWGTATAWSEQRPIFGPTTYLFELDPWRVVDIDTPDDWRRAELLFELLERHGDL